MVEVRAATAADAVGIADVYAPYVTDSVASFEDVAPGADEVAARMRGGLWFVACEGAEVVGFAYASPHRSRAAYRWAVDVSCYVADALRGRGVGRALYDVLLPRVRAAGLVTAHAGITLPNAASVGLHESFGFTKVAHYPHVGFKHGAWHDVGWWQLRLVDELPVPPG